MNILVQCNNALPCNRTMRTRADGQHSSVQTVGARPNRWSIHANADGRYMLAQKVGADCHVSIVQVVSLYKFSFMYSISRHGFANPCLITKSTMMTDITTNEHKLCFSDKNFLLSSADSENFDSNKKINDNDDYIIKYMNYELCNYSYKLVVHEDFT